MRVVCSTSFAVAVLLTIGSPNVSAQAGPEAVRASSNAPVPVIRAARREGAIVLDGRLDEKGWENATPATEFTQSYPNPGLPAVDRTEVRVLYDDAALYVGIRMFDPRPDSIAAQLARRDASGIYSDWVHLIIDSYHDRRTAFRFTVNPRGVQKDVYTSNDGNEDLNWDAVWEVETRVDKDGWVAEYRIPFSQLRFGSASGSERVWGFQIMRDVARRNERTSFSPWTPQDPGFVSRFGDLVGLVDIQNPSRLEIQPYVSGQATRAPGDKDNPFFNETDFKPSAGADVRWGIPGGLTLTATVNPDFGQVEVDPAVVNLSAFETFFPEKRPFFLEGSDVFSFGQVRRNNDYGSQTFLYSRRIGRRPQGGAGGPGIEYVESPQQTTIAGAAKLTGKRGPWTIGILDALTPEEKADVDSTSGARAKIPVEPMTNYFAGRVRRDFRNGQTVVGAMVTNTLRNLSGDEFDGFLTSQASFGGLDFEHSWKNRVWTVSGFTSVSEIRGTAQAIDGIQRAPAHYLHRPDAVRLKYKPTRTSLSGHLSEVAINRTGTIFGSIAVKNVSPTFEINDFGFHGRMDYRSWSQIIGYQDFIAKGIFRSKSFYAYSNHTWNFDRARIFDAYAAGGDLSFSSQWSAGFSGGFNPEYYSDRLTRGGPLAIVPSGWNAFGYVNTDSRKPVIFSLNLNQSADASDASSTSISVSAAMRPTTSLRITVGPGLSIDKNTSQYIRGVNDVAATSTFGRRHVFADLRQVTLSMDTRVEWTLSPRLSLQTYVQPFVAAGSYSNFKEFRRPRAFEFDVYGVDKGTITRDATTQSYTVDPDGAGASPSFGFSDPRFNIRSLRGNAVLRWEYRPGSALYFVWQQQRESFEPIGEFETGRDVGAIFRTVPTNIFLVKATYWFSR